MPGDIINKILNRLLKTEKINRLLKNRYLPGWVIFLFDIAVVIMTFVLSYNLRYSVSDSGLKTIDVLKQSVIVLIVYFGVFYLVKPYAGIIRHTTSHDIQKIFRAVLFATFVLGTITVATRLLDPSSATDIPFSVLVIHGSVTAFLLTFSRIFIKYVYYFISKGDHRSIPVLIYGAGDLGQLALLAVERSHDPVYNVVGFIDSNLSMQGKYKSGKPIYSPEKAINKIIPGDNVKIVIVAVKPGTLSAESSRKLIDYCMDNRVELRKVPPVSEWLNGAFDAKQMRKISVDDLLGREEIRLDIKRIQEGLVGKVILVTGAAGSIGSEIVRQLMSFRTGKIILLDQAESAMYYLISEIRKKYNGNRDFETVIADITDSRRMESVFDNYRPAIVFNAAAYKHVPLLEDNVYEAVAVNIGGTRLLADLSVKYGVEKFVMISSDKAVNPTSVMGASKRVCELYVQAVSGGEGCTTQFITTRFGNVLGSNGSVVPVFMQQIESGGPVTLTHRDMKRYFMTIPEACQLVLEAGFMGRGGEIYVFDMGEPVRIYDLAVKMILLAGLQPGKDIKIIETGLRPGEKMFEELLASKEDLKPTHNPKILIATMNHIEKDKIISGVKELINAAGMEGDLSLVKKIKALVPEFVPANERFRNL